METTENEVEIFGVVSVPASVDAEAFENDFLAWLESKGYKFGGGIGPINENELPR